MQSKQGANASRLGQEASLQLEPFLQPHSYMMSGFGQPQDLKRARLGAVGGEAAGPVLGGTHIPLQDGLVAAAGAEQVAGPGHAAHPRPVPVHRAHPGAQDDAIASDQEQAVKGLGDPLRKEINRYIRHDV